MVRGVIHIINPYDPGKFPEDISKKYGISKAEIISLSSNENPFPPPESVKKVYEEAFNKVNLYPHPFYRDLKEKIAEYTGVDEELIAVGNGASELLKMICEVNLEAFDPVVIPIPGYTLYAILAMLMDASIRFLEFPGYRIKAEEILKENGKLTFLCSPNNPTGNLIDGKELEKILRKAEGLVVVDEAYTEFSKKSHLKLLKKYDNLIIVRSFSKFFSLAGLRVGYAMGNEETIKAIEKIRLPFNISGISAMVAKACLESVEYFEMIRDEIVRERERVLKELKKFDGIGVYPSDANFILIKIKKEKDFEKEFQEFFERKGIILRNVTGLLGLDGLHFRVTIGKSDQNDKFLSALEEILG
ncbi:MAG: histidinol-phosphate transaminase [Archaeoglobus sp.]|nr:histidinol-phosphate transaminase [Archaeoglobus sp.]